MSQSGVKTCKYCASKIHPEASICLSCKKSQNIFYNYLLSLTSIAAGLAVIVASGSFFITFIIPEMSKRLGAPIEVIKVESYVQDNGIKVSILNKSDDISVASEVSIYVPSITKGFYFGASYPLTKTLEPNSISNIEISPFTGESSYQEVQTWRGSGVDSLHPDIFWSLDGSVDPKCFSVKVVAPELAGLFYEQSHQTPIFVPVEAWLKYYSGVDGKWKNTKILAKGLLLVVSTKKCLDEMKKLPIQDHIIHPDSSLYD